MTMIHLEDQRRSTCVKHRHGNLEMIRDDRPCLGPMRHGARHWTWTLEVGDRAETSTEEGEVRRLSQSMCSYIAPPRSLSLLPSSPLVSSLPPLHIYSIPPRPAVLYLFSLFASPPPDSTRMKTSISSDVWEKKKALIAKLYMEEEWPLKQVIKQIRSDDFNPR